MLPANSCKPALLHIKAVTPKGSVTEKLYSQSLCSIYIHYGKCSKRCAYNRASRDSPTRSGQGIPVPYSRWYTIGRDMGPSAIAPATPESCGPHFFSRLDFAGENLKRGESVLCSTGMIFYPFRPHKGTNSEVGEKGGFKEQYGMPSCFQRRFRYVRRKGDSGPA
jgi:hypothetical protein